MVPIAMGKKTVANQEAHLDSIPRLELVAALASAMMRDLLVREAGEDFTNVVMFSDSSTVLRWINDFDRRFRTFENFRLNRIRNLTNVADWRHCPTEANPADLCSKGIDAHDLKKFEFLHNGPDFLREEECNWPPRFPKVTPSSIANEAVEVSEEIGLVSYAVLPQELPDFEPEPKKVVVTPYHLLAISPQTAEDAPEMVVSAQNAGDVPETNVLPWPLRVAERRSTWMAKCRL